MSSQQTTVPGTVERDNVGNVAILTLTREGRANAWGPDMAESLLRRIVEVNSDQDVHACVLTGNGTRAFSSGADIGAPGAHQATSVGSVIKTGTSGTHAVFDALSRFPKPLVCAVNGLAIGAGFLLALYADVVLAVDSAEFAMPQVALGVLPAYGGIYRLATWVGRGHATELVLSGRRLGAVAAEHYGIVTEVCDGANLMDRALDTAKNLGTMPPLAVAMAKESIRVAYELAGSQITSLLDQYRFGMLALTEDSAEAHLAWREHRPPEYRGR